MTLKIPFRYFLPVLDSPAKKPGSRRFVNRRPVSLAGKPLLAEKHIQIQPSQSLLSRKCYSTTAAALFRQQKQISRKARFRPDFRASTFTPEMYENSRTALFSMPRIVSRRPNIDLRDSPVTSLKEADAPAEFSICGCPATAASPAAAFIDRIIVAGYDFPLPETSYQLLATEDRIMNLVGLESFLESVKTVLQTPTRFYSGKNEPRRKFISRRPSISGHLDFADACLAFENRPPRGHFDPVHFQTGAVQEYDEPEYDLCRSQRPAAFLFKIQLPNERPGPDPEVHANFILESDGRFAAVCDHNLQPPQVCNNLTFAAADTNRQLFPIFKHNNELHDCNILADRIPDNMPLSSVKRQAVAICTGHPKADIPRFSAAGKGMFRPAAADYRLKLRLKLKRLQFSSFDAALNQITPGPAMIPCLPPATRLHARFKAMQRQNPLPTIFQHQQARTATQIDFRQKRSQFYLRASQHARYTLRTLRHIFTTGESGDHLQTSRPAGIVNPKQAVIPILLPNLSPSEPPTRQFSQNLIRKAAPPFTGIKPGFVEFSPSLTLIAEKPGFTDIIHPERLRNLTSAGRHSVTLKCETSQRRLKCLKQLRFRLQPIKADCLIFRNHPVAAINCKHDPGPIIGSANRSLQLKVIDLAATRMRHRQLRPSHKLRLKRAAIRHRLPGQILENLHLEMSIAGKQPPSSLRQKHFLYPSVWDRKIKPFSCRLWLLPHPFGFPEFNFTPSIFRCLQSRPEMTILTFSTSRANIDGSFFLKRDRIFLPPLSMKDPRRFLNIFTMPSQVRELFKLPRLTVDSRPVPPESPAKFMFQWQKSSHADSISIGRNTRMSSSRRVKIPAFSCNDRMPRRQRYQEQPEDFNHLEIPMIHRMLLRARRFTIRQRRSECIEISIACSRNYQPVIAFPVLPVPDTRPGASEFNLFNPPVDKFLHQWPEISASGDALSGYFRMRLRSFRFPWHPESGRYEAGREQYSLLPRSSLIQNLGFADEIRAAAFFFPWIDQIRSSSCFKYGFLKSDKLVHINRPDSFIHAKPVFQNRPWHQPRSMNVETAGFSQFFDPDRFFKFREKATATLRKVRQTVSFKHPLKSIRPANFSCCFSEFGLKNSPPASMTLDSLHWIIMMRSFISPLNPHFVFYPEVLVSEGKLTKDFPTSKVIQKQSAFLNHDLIINTDCLAGQRHEKMCMSFSDPEKSFSTLPINLDRQTKIALLRLEERFSAIVDKALYAAKTCSNVMPAGSRQAFSIALNTDETSLEETSKSIVIPAMRKTGSGGTFVPVARLNMLRPGFKHAYVPDWIDTSHARPTIGH